MNNPNSKINKKKIGRIYRKDKHFNNDFQNYYCLTNENHHNPFHIFKNLSQFNNFENMLLTYKNNSDLKNECKLLKSSILELNEQLKEKDAIISNLKRRINSMSSETNRNKMFQIKTEKCENERENEGDLLNFNELNIIDDRFCNTLTDNRKHLESDSFRNSNKFSLTFRNSTKSKIVQENSYVKHKPFTLTYFRYKEQISKKKSDLNAVKNNLQNQFNNDEVDKEKNNIKKNDKNISLSEQKIPKKNQLIHYQRKEQNEKNKTLNHTSLNSKTHRNLNSFNLNSRISKNKEKKVEKKEETKKELKFELKKGEKKEEKKNKINNHNNKNKHKISIKKRNFKLGISYKELQQMKILHDKPNIMKKEKEKEKEKINDNDQEMEMKHNNNNDKEVKISHFINLKKKSSKKENEKKIKFVDFEEGNHSNKDEEKIFESIEEQNLKDLKNKLQSEIKSFSKAKGDKNEDYEMNYYKDINEYKSNTEYEKRDSLSNKNEEEMNNELLISIKKQFSLTQCNFKKLDKKEKESSHNSSSLILVDKQKDYLNDVGTPAKEDNSNELNFERSFSDIHIEDFDIPSNEK